jgi:uncharacterized protein
MLSFDLRSLESKAVRVDGRLAANDPVWEAGDTVPVDAVLVSGRLSSAGPGRFYFSGQLEGTISAACRRCLTDVRADVHEEIHMIFAEEGNEEADDPDVYVLNPRAPVLDLRPAIREEWLLAVPAFVLCREDCKGLCPRCGVDLNTGACSCAPETDSRWDVLRTLPETES